MAVTIGAFRTRFPQFADEVAYPDALLDEVIAEAGRRISPTFFGDRADDAHRLLTAHLLVSTVSSASATGIQSVTAGSASITYSSGADASDLTSTGFGKQYQALIKLIGGARLVC